MIVTIQQLAKRLTCLVCSTFFLQPLFASEAPVIGYAERFQPVIAEHGMVASQEVIASRVGRDILRRGGNAVDAAVATGFALMVTLPRAGALGGGGFMVVHLAKQNKTITIDYRETAPAAARPDLYIDENGDVDMNRARFSHQSAGVPGTVSGLVHALDKYGTMSLKEVITPAIKLASNGIVVTYSLQDAVNSRAKTLRANQASRKKFFKRDGVSYKAGEKWKQKDLAKTLRLIAKHGPDVFYRGAIAKSIVTDMQANGGLITQEDLAGYVTKEREPVVGTYRGFSIASMPPPSSGGIHLIQMLNILEGFDLLELKQNSAASLHVISEAMKYAYADRSKYLGDPDFYPVPVTKIIDKEYARNVRAVISSVSTPSSAIHPGKMLPAESPSTTHFSVVDKYGNAVSNTYTLNFSFGSGITVPGTGILLNNQMDDFSAKAGIANGFGLVGGVANQIEAQKRPLSSMTPTIVFKDGKPWLVTGSPGGSRIINTTLQTILNTVDYDQNIAAATASARIHHQWLPDKLVVERGISADTIKLLSGKGHDVEVRGRSFGSAQSIMVDGGFLYGASDSRRPGAGVAGY